MRALFITYGVEDKFSLRKKSARKRCLHFCRRLCFWTRVSNLGATFITAVPSHHGLMADVNAAVGPLKDRPLAMLLIKIAAWMTIR